MYEQQILKIFSDVGRRGISVHLLAKHVYNMNCTLFEQPEIKEVVRETRNYVVRNSSGKQPILERTDRWGFYRLNNKGQREAQQLLPGFQDEDTAEQEEEKPPQDFSLNLFADF